MAKRGPKNKYETLNIADRLPEIEGWARDGYRDEDMWKALGIGRGTFYNWKGKYPEFAEALARGKEVVDAEIENALLKNAEGHVFWEEEQERMPVLMQGRPVFDEDGNPMYEMVTTKRKLKYIKPDTTAQIFWLKNRKPDVWRDKQHMEHSGGIGVGQLDYMTDEELDEALKGLKGDGQKPN